MARSRARHRPEVDAEQIQFHYDVSDDFYALWLDPQRVYSCAYFRDAGMDARRRRRRPSSSTSARKLMLKEGERFLDIGAGWGGLLLFAAENYGVRAHGITLSKNQHAHVNKLIARARPGRPACAWTCSTTASLDESEPYDKIASVGMFEHVGRARLPDYFAKIHRLLKPGGLLLNHGITAGGTRNHQLGSGLGDFIERYIFPGGELMHVSHVLERPPTPGSRRSTSRACARTTRRRSGPGATRSRRSSARRARSPPTPSLRAYRLYLAGSAMCFERAWLSLHQMLCARPHRRRRVGADARRTIGVPLQPRLHVPAALSRASDVPIQVARPTAT